MKSLKNIPQNWDFCIEKHKIASFEEISYIRKEKDLEFEEVFMWFWGMSESKRYPQARLDFLKEEMIETLEKAKIEAEHLYRSKGGKKS